MPEMAQEISARGELRGAAEAGSKGVALLLSCEIQTGLQRSARRSSRVVHEIPRMVR